MPVGGATKDGLEGRLSSLCVSKSEGGGGCATTDGEADAARSCSSRPASAMGDGDDFAKAERTDFPGCTKGSVDGRGDCSPEKGNESVASSKQRPLQGEQCQWNRTTVATKKINSMLRQIE